MEQTGNFNNNLQIGNAGFNNTFNVAQSHGRLPDAELTGESSQAFSVTKREVRKNAIQTFLITFSMLAMSIVSITSDSISLAEKIGFSLKWLLIVTIPLTFVPMWRHLDEIRYFFKRPKRSNTANYAGEGEIIEDDGTGNYLIYKPTCKCTYPNCKGSVILTNAPPRERGRIGKTYVGICSVAGKDHSYFVDFNLMAYKERFDWRPFEKK